MRFRNIDGNVLRQQIVDLLAEAANVPASGGVSWAESGRDLYLAWAENVERLLRTFVLEPDLASGLTTSDTGGFVSCFLIARSTARRSDHLRTGLPGHPVEVPSTKSMPLFVASTRQLGWS